MMDLSNTIDRLRQALIAPPDEPTAHRHLAAMRRAATGLPSAARRGLVRALLVAASVTAIAASLPVVMPREALPGGIATSTSIAATRIVEAGIDSGEVGTDQAGTQSEQAGLEPSSEGSNEHGERVSDTARTTDKEGREKGEEVSDTASSKSVEHRKDAEKRPETNPAGITPGEGKKAGGKPDAPPAGSRGKGKGKG